MGLDWVWMELLLGRRLGGSNEARGRKEGERGTGSWIESVDLSKGR